MIFRTVFTAGILAQSALACAGHGTHPALERRGAIKDAQTSSNSGLDTLHKGIRALGGKKALDRITGVIYEAPNTYRSLSLMQSYNMLKADTYISISGSQNMSFAYSPGKLQQRIDRNFLRSEYWYFAFPDIVPVDFSLVVQDADSNRFASFVHGNNALFYPTDATAGYQDNVLMGYLLREANALSPKLLSLIAENNNYTTSEIEIHPGVKLPAVHDRLINYTVIFDDKTYLPYIVRSYEDHYVYGPSTRDRQLTNYTKTNGVMFPSSILTIYNNDSIIEEFYPSKVTVNPEFPAGLFSGKPEGSTIISKTPPPPINENVYSETEVGENFENMLWIAPYNGTYKYLEATHPSAQLPNLWHIKVPTGGDYEGLVLDFDDGVMVLDAPPHQSDLIIEWVKKTLKKPITKVWPTHHHHDHSGGMSAFTAINATLIVPEIASEYWSIAAPGASIITYDDTKPYIHNDKSMQVRFLWEQQALHSVDWSYAVVTTACPGPNDDIVAFEADVYTPTDMSELGFARQWLQQVESDGLSSKALIVAAHGSQKLWDINDLVTKTGYVYPDLNTQSWKTGGGICLT